MSPQDIPITDITSDENGRDVVDGTRNPNDRMLMLNDEVVNMTQRQLTSEIELAEFSNMVRKLKFVNTISNVNYHKRFTCSMKLVI